jgi:hypothetical protein
MDLHDAVQTPERIRYCREPLEVVGYEYPTRGEAMTKPISPTGWLTIREASELSGLTLGAVRRRLEPGHPDHIPNMCYPTENPNGQLIHRIPADEFAEWLADHKR